jgi:hypothetical protein
MDLRDVTCIVPGGESVERAYHELFAEYRVYPDREWFTVRGALTEFLKPETRRALDRDRWSNRKRRSVEPPQPAETAPAATPRETATTATHWVVGLDQGAAWVGLSVDAFRKRRQRAGGQAPGEVRQGGRPAWPEDDLTAWRESWPRVVGE